MSDTVVHQKHVAAGGDYQQTKGKRSEKRIPTGKLFGLRKFDLVRTIKGVGFIKGKRSSGYFALMDIFNNTVTASVNVKKNCQRLTAKTTKIIQEAAIPPLSYETQGFPCRFFMKKMSVYDLVKKTRSFRRFDQSFKIDLKTIEDLINLAVHSASAANLQPLKYIISIEDGKNEEIFSCLTWAAYLKDWKGPGDGEKPSAYIVVMGDRSITENFRCDHGIAAQSILLGATEQGLGGCMLAAINHKKLRNFLNIPDHLEVLLVIALGRPAETVVLDKAQPGESIKYWRDDDDVHHVPKRGLDEIIVSSYK